MTGPDTTAADDGPLRALRVLEALSGMEQPASLLAVAAAAMLPKTKAYRALRTLQDAGFVDRADRDGYRLGSRSVALASLMGPRPALLQTTRPVLARLVAVTQAGASLHLRSGAHRVLVLGLEAPHQPLNGAVVAGERAPLTTGCSGAVILAHLPPDEVDAILKDQPSSRARVSSLARIRSEGYALSFSGNHTGLNGVAAPLLDPDDGLPLGSLALAGWEDRLDEPALRRLSGPLIAACQELGPRLARLLGPNSSERHRALDVTVPGSAP